MADAIDSEHAVDPRYRDMDASLQPFERIHNHQIESTETKDQGSINSYEGGIGESIDNSSHLDGRDAIVRRDHFPIAKNKMPVPDYIARFRNSDFYSYLSNAKTLASCETRLDKSR